MKKLLINLANLCEPAMAVVIDKDLIKESRSQLVSIDIK